MSLNELCQAIDEGYAAGKTGLDSDMLELLIELADRTTKIRELFAFVEQVARLTSQDDMDKRNENNDGMSGDDACETVCSLIRDARELLNKEPK